jgi:hypothetical protein
MIVRGSWPYGGNDGHDPHQASRLVALAFAVAWATAALVMLVLKLLA